MTEAHYKKLNKSTLDFVSPEYLEIAETIKKLRNIRFS